MSTFEPVLSGLPGLDHMLNNIVSATMLCGRYPA